MKSQFVEVERLTAFGPRFLDEGVKLGARTLVIYDFSPTLVTFCKLAQLIKHSTTLGFAQLRQFLDDFRCIIATTSTFAKAYSSPRISPTGLGFWFDAFATTARPMFQ